MIGGVMNRVGRLKEWEKRLEPCCGATPHAYHVASNCGRAALQIECPTCGNKTKVHFNWAEALEAWRELRKGTLEGQDKAALRSSLTDEAKSSDETIEPGADKQDEAKVEDISEDLKHVTEELDEVTKDSEAVTDTCNTSGVKILMDDIESEDISPVGDETSEKD